MIIECSNIKKSFQGDYLLKDVSFKVNDHDKLAIIGVNGAGKTTILKILADQLEYDSGSVFKNKDLTMGYLSQQHDLDMNKSIYMIALDVFQHLIDLENRIRDLEVKMLDDHSPETLDLYDKLSHSFSEQDGFFYTSKVEAVLKGLGFVKEEFDSIVSTLSGGQKTRLALAKLLLQEPSLLLLDEPTNHLDASAISFLEGYLKGYPHAIVFVSHDRYFINQISTVIVEIENGKSMSYACNYETYSIRKQQIRTIELNHYMNQQKDLKKMQDSIDQLKSFNREKSIKRAESKEKQLAKIERIERPESLPSNISINFTPRLQSGFDVCKIENLAMSYDQPLFRNVSFPIHRGDRIALVGENGIGKTTLFKGLLKLKDCDEGKIRLGAKVEMAYYDQEHTSLSLNKTIFNEISDTYPKMNNTEIRNILALFNFRGEDVFKEMFALSGGEKGRVVLTKLLLQQANFLVLDEPTNHLDISSKEVLEDALNEFDGTILFISHDRYFINKIATKIVELTPTGAIIYDGNYEYYMNHKYMEEDTKEVVVTESKIQRVESKKQKNELRKLEREIASLEEQLEAQKVILGKEETVNDYVAYNDCTALIEQLETSLEPLLDEWLALQE